MKVYHFFTKLEKHNDNFKKFLDIKAKFHDYQIFFTDGSKGQDEELGIGVYCLEKNIEKAYKIPGHMSICMAETIAIFASLKEIDNKNIGKALIFSDSKSAIEKISNPRYTFKNDYMTIESRTLINKFKKEGKKIILGWIT